MGEAGCADDGSELRQVCARELRMALKQEACAVVAERAAYAGHLEAVGEAVVNEDATGAGQHLRLVLQATERGRKDETVVVALKLGAVVARALLGLKTEAFGA